MNTVLGRLRLVGYCEAVSFLLLLGVAMPLKYAVDMPQPTKIAGAIHGGLWILYLLAIFQARSALKWSSRRVAGGIVASVLPFGPFVFDASLRRDEESAEKA